MDNIDIKTSFVHKDIGDEFINMQLRGNRAEMMAKKNPDICYKYIQICAK